MKLNKLLGIVIATAFILNSFTSFAQLNPFNVPKLAPGDSVVIYYDVTINNPCGCSQITNQGTVSGTNFVTMNTDDPDTGPIGDATVTSLNMFPLPVSVYELRADVRNGGIEVGWKVSSETNMLKYEVERSGDGRIFNKIGENLAANRYSLTGYTYLDQSPLPGVNFYRLREVEQSGAVRYSRVVRVDQGKRADFTVFPNPVESRSMTIQITNLPRGNYELVLYDNLGQSAYRKLIVHDGGSMSKLITLPTGIAKGIYNIRLSEKEQLFSRLIMIQ